MGKERQKTLLLVEDEALIALAEKEELESCNYAVVTADSGEEAINIFKNRNNIDLVLMDINLGNGMDGTEAARKILINADVPIVFLSSHTEKETVERTEKITSYGYVVKNSGITVLDTSIKMAFRLFQEKLKVREQGQELAAANEKLEQANEKLLQTNERIEESQRELIQREQALKESEEKYRLLADNSVNVIWQMDLKLKFTYISPSVFNMTGYTQEECIGTRLSHHATRKEFFKMARYALKAIKNYKTLNQITLEANMLKKNGEEFPVEIIGKLLMNDKGSPMGLQGSMRDITERKQSEAELLKSESLLDATGRTGKIGGWEHDLNTGKVLWTRALFDILEIPYKKEPPGVNEHLGYYPVKDREVLEKAYRKAVEKGDPFDLELQAYTDKLKPIWCRVQGEPIIKNGKCHKLRGILQDITEYKNAVEQFETIFEMSLDLICIADINTATFIKVSPSFTSVLGYSEEELLGHPFLEFIHPEDVGPTIDSLEKDLKTGKNVLRFQNRYRTKNNNYLWLEWANHPVPEHGLTYSVAHDVTERKQFEKAISESEEKYRTLFEQLVQGVVYIRADGQFIDFNNAALEMFGLTREQLMGKTLLDLRLRMIREDGSDLPEEQHPSTLALVTGKPVYHEIIRVFNDRKQEFIWLSVNAIPQFKEGEDRPYQVFITLHDISKIKQAEDALREEKDWAQKYLDIAGVLFIAVNKQGNITLANSKAVQILGYKQEEIIGMNWFDNFLSEKTREEAKTVFTKLMVGDVQPVEYAENVIVSRGGEERTVAWHNTIIKDDDGVITGTLSSGEDITDRKISEEKISFLLEEKEIILKEVHHRIKNNMNTLMSMLTLQAGRLDEESAKKALGTAHNRISTMMVLYDKLYRSKTILEISIREYLGSLIDEVLSTYPFKVNVVKNIDDVPIPVRIASPIGIILNELISNAMKHAFSQGRDNVLEIIVTGKGNHISLTVQDNGRGLENPTDQEGFGLTLVSALTKQIKGDMRIENNSGTKCILEFDVW